MPTDAEIRFTEIQYAAGTVKTKRLANWIAREEITLFSEKRRSWHKFCHLDVLHVAMVRELVDMGIPVREADRMSHAFLLSRMPVGVKSITALDDAKILPTFRRRALIVFSPKAGEYDWRDCSTETGVLAGDLGEDVWSFLVVYAELVALGTFARLNEVLIDDDAGEIIADDATEPKNAEKWPPTE